MSGWNGQGSLHTVAPAASGPGFCRPSCCKTPYGHAAQVVGCACHPPSLELLIAMRDDPTAPDVA